jgi:antitoxin component of RelBE/YafQ-DinJ toxin-antitoxin module
MNYVGTMATTKDERIYIRIKSEIKEDFEKVATYRGLTPSALLHSLIVKTIHQVKEEKPQVFSEVKAEKPENEKLNFSGKAAKKRKNNERELLDLMDREIDKFDSEN